MTTQVVQTESFSGSDTSFTAPGTLQCLEDFMKQETQHDKYRSKGTVSLKRETLKIMLDRCIVYYI